MEFLTTFEPDKVGAFLNVPSEVYHSAPGDSNSSLKAIGVSPLDYKRYKTGQVKREETEYMEYGQLFHSAVLENRDLSELCYVQPELYAEGTKPWHNGAKECRQWREMHADKPILSAYDFEQLKKEVTYVKNHRDFGLLLGAYTEVSCFARDPETGYLLKGRLDALKYFPVPGVRDRWLIGDVKTCQDASTAGFSREILKRKYHVQAAMYRRIVRRLTKCDDVLFVFFAVEKGPCMKMNVRFLSQQAMDVGDKVLDKYMATLRACRITDTWPEWADQEDAIGYIDLPDFCYENEELTGLTEIE